MIDLRAVVQEIVKTKDASDAAAYRAHVHNHLRAYGQQLLSSLAQAIVPTTPEEVAIVGWLQQRLIAVAQQIPEYKKET